MVMVVQQTGIRTKRPAKRIATPETIAILLFFISSGTKLMNLLPTTPSRIPKTPIIMAMMMSTLATSRSRLPYCLHSTCSALTVSQAFHKPSDCTLFDDWWSTLCTVHVGRAQMLMVPTKPMMAKARPRSCLSQATMMTLKHLYSSKSKGDVLTGDSGIYLKHWEGSGYHLVLILRIWLWPPRFLFTLLQEMTAFSVASELKLVSKESDT